MGEMAEGLINGDFDFHTGEYLGEGGGFPRTASGNVYSKRARKISRELRNLILSKQAKCTTEKEKNIALTEARTEINVKYGKGWRDR